MDESAPITFTKAATVEGIVSGKKEQISVMTDMEKPYNSGRFKVERTREGLIIVYQLTITGKLRRLQIDIYDACSAYLFHFSLELQLQASAVPGRVLGIRSQK